MSSLRSVVTFTSDAFNTSKPEPYFLNPGCFGDDVARWMMERLRAFGFGVDKEPTQEDFGWFFEYEVAGIRHCFVLGYRPGGDGGTWIGTVERSTGLLGALAGGRRRFTVGSLQAIHRVLEGADEIHAFSWHVRDEDDPDVSTGSSTPDAPAA